MQTAALSLRTSRIIGMLFVMAGAMGSSAQTLTVAKQTNLTQLAAAITGPGVVISNPVMTCDTIAYGTFAYSGTALDVQQGVILTSGKRIYALGPNNSGSKSHQISSPGDAELNIVTGRTTYDACKFEFDIIPSGDSLRFDFVFGSEEYNEWVGSQFNDVFGFFISGPGIIGDPGIGADHNIALVPGTATACAINNINNGSNQAYYQDNAGGAETQYDGYTVGLSAKSGVTACQSYHLKLVVADASDKKLDSGVLINTVSSNAITMSSFTANGTTDMVEGCNAGTVRFSRPFPRVTPLNIQYYLTGTATNGTDYSTIAPVNPLLPHTITIPANQTFMDQVVNPLSDALAEPTEYLRFILGNPFCPAVPLDTLIFNITDSVFATCSAGGTICAGGSMPFTVSGGAAYSWSPTTGLSCSNCPDPTASPANTTWYQITVSDGSCVRVFNREVKVSLLALSATITNVLCNGGSNGAINLGISGGIAPYTYSWTGPGGFTATTQDLTNVIVGTYTVTVSDAACTRTQSFNVTGPATLSVSLAPAILAFGQNITCFGGNDGSIDATISGGTGPYTISWTGPSGYSSTLVDISNLIAGPYTLSITDNNGCTASASSTLIQTTQVLASITSITPVNCFGDGLGSATANGSGGVPPYAYSWNSAPVQSTATATALSAATYTVTVTDGYGCSTTANATITGPTVALSTALTSQTNVLCHGNSTGAASISISGGTAPYSTSWNTAPVQNGTSAINLPAGTWTATVTDANGCSTTRAVTITEPVSSLSASLFSQTNVQCFGNSTGSATASASGGTGPYTYQWNSVPAQNTATAGNLTAGSYACTVRDVNLCAVVVNVTIAQPASAITANVTSQTNVLCYGASSGGATVAASGGTAPLTYSWNSSPVQSTATLSNVPAGSYTCTIIDANGCSTSRNVTITQPAAALQASNVSHVNETCFGSLAGSATISVTGGSGSYSISWNTVPVQTTLTATGLAAGIYTAMVTDNNGCANTASVSVIITGPSAAMGMTFTTGNPFCAGDNTGRIDIFCTGGVGGYTFAWTGPSGFTSTSEDFPSGGLVAGSYNVTVTDGNGCTIAQPFTLVNPAALAVSGTATNVNCFGQNNGAIAITASGATPPYVYSWTGPGGFVSSLEDIGSLIAGTYTLWLRDANGCELFQSWTVTQPAILSASIASQTNIACTGGTVGSATVAVTGGTTNYSYSWNTSPVQTTATATNLTAGTYTCTATDAHGCNTSVSVTITQPGSALSASIGLQTNVLCFGNATGNATTFVSGGVGPYTYSWNSSPVQTNATAVNLVAGTYTCTATDANGCTAGATATITQPASAISASITSQTNVLCNGNATGSATVTASGGTGALSYSWNTTPVQTTATAIALVAGSYTCTITDANGCSTSSSVTITQPASTISASITSQTNVLCFGNTTGSLTVTASGGTGTLNFSWNSSPVQTTATATGLVAGSYTCTITDANGCSTTASATITQPASALSASIGSQTNVLCFGNAAGNATTFVSGGVGPYTYSWDSSPVQTNATAVNLVAGTYTCTATDANGCTAGATATITQPASAISASITSQTNVLCNGSATGSATVSASGGTGALSYSWNTSPVQTNATATGLVAGSYTCTITDANGCSTSSSVAITQPATAVSISGVVTPATCGGAATGAVNVTVSGGVGPYGWSWTGPGAFSANTEDISALTSGVYTLTSTDANGCSAISTFNVGQPGLFTVSGITGTYTGGWNVSCFGGANGSIDMTVSGGTLPYTHAWTGPNGFTSSALDITGLEAGNYTYQLTDANGCSTSATFNLTQPTQVGFATSGVNGITCNGDANAAVTVAGNGGTAPYTYSWTSIGGFTSNSASISGLGPDSYSIVVADANGCTDGGLNTFQFVDPAILSPGATVTSNVSCFGGNNGIAAANVTGGGAPYAISWNAVPVQTGANANGLTAGTYTVTVTDARGCVRTQNVSVTQPAAVLSAGISAQTNVNCFANATGSATVSVIGGTPNYSYDWNSSPNQTAATATNLVAGTYTCTITDANGCTTTASVTITQPAAAIGASISASTNVSCFGNATGSATVNASGGTPSYSYGWNSVPVQTSATAINLTAGSYICTITDANGCTAAASVTITQPANALSASIISQVNVACGGTTGSATVGAIGGTPLYSYSWNTVPVQTNATASNLGAGTYACTITDANGCTTSVSATITAPAGSLSAIISSTSDVLCFGNSTGSATASITGGTLPYAISWNTSPVQNTATSSNLPAGTWTCTITDNNGCTSSVNAVIAQPSADLVANISASTDVSCFGNASGSATVDITGGTPNYNIAWNSVPAQVAATATNLVSGNYTVTITDANGCSANTTVAIDQPFAALAATISAQTNVACGGTTGSATANANGGTWPYAYSWNTFPVQTGVTATGLGAGTWTCTITDGAGCSTSVDATITAPAGSLSVSIASQVDVACSGNATGSATANISGGTLPYTIDWNSSPAQNTITATGLGAGAYTCTVTDGNGCTSSANVVIAQPAQSLATSIIASQGVSCFGAMDGTATADATGGTAPYNHTWDTAPVQNNATMSGVDAGTYTVTATDANGCSATASTTINTPSAALNVSLLTSSAQSCYGTANGQATVNATGGTAPYAFTWNTVPAQTGATVSGLIAGTWTVNVNDANGCSATLDVVIDGPTAPLALAIDSVNDVLCYSNNSGNATVSASGGLAPYSYTWNTTPVQTGQTAYNLFAGTWTATVVDGFGCSSSINVLVQQPIIGISAFVEDMQDVFCFGDSSGFATFEVSGGSGAYTMEWNTVPPQYGATATGLPVGTWTISINDVNGCDSQKDFPVTIDGPSAPIAISGTTTDFNGAAISCVSAADGAIDVNVSGGTPGYFFSWSGPGGFTANTEDISGLAAGTYDLAITDLNGCSASWSITLSTPVPMNATAGITTATCGGASNGAVDVTVTDGVAPYTFVWSGPGGFSATSEDISAIPAGVYDVIVTDANGCLAGFFFNVNEPGAFVVNATLSSYPGGNNTSCDASSDGAIDATITGGTMPYTYLWDGPGGFSANTEDISGLAAGNYDLTIVDANGCGTLAQYTLTAPATLFNTLFAFTYPSGGNVSCDGEVDGAIDATITGGTPGFVTAWNGPNGFTAITEDITGLEPGTYTMTVWDVNGCSATQGVTLTSPAAINASLTVSQYNSGDAVDCNGASTGIIDISINGGLAPYSVSWTGPGGYASNNIDISGLAAGTYTAIVSDAAGCDTTLSVTLTEPTSVTSSGTTSMVNGYEVGCNASSDGSIDLSVLGGAGNYTYQWNGPSAFVSTSEDISALSAGMYDVLITDMNGCASTLSFTLDAPAPVAASAVIATAACMGSNTGAVDLTISGGVPPYAVQWIGPAGFNSAAEDLTGLFAGIYDAIITDANGCVFTQSYDVNQPGQFTVSANTSIYPGGYNVSCSYASDGAIDVTASGGTPPLFFSWNGPGVFSSISEDISGLAPGTYDLTITDVNGCGHLESWTLIAPATINVGLTASQYAGGVNVGCMGSFNGSIDAGVIGGVAPYAITWSGPNGFVAISEDITGLEAGTYTINVVDAVGCGTSATITLVEPTPIDIQVTASIYPSGGNVSCDGEADGSIDMDLTGGSLLYFINWTGPNGFASNNEDLSGLEAGVYTVSVIDANGCNTTATVNIVGPNPILVDLVISQYSGGYAIGCSGDSSGTIDANVQGGAIPWTYLWTGPGGFTSTAQDLGGVPAGDYTLVVTDAAGCSATANVTLTEPTPIDATAILSDAGNGFEIGCAGDDGAIDLTITGGSAPFIYDWSGSGGFASLNEDLSGLGAGTYDVLVTDVNGCSVSVQYTLDQAGALVAALTVSGNVCDGLDDGAIDVTVSGGVAPFTFDWSGTGGFTSTDEDVDSLAGGSYSVIVSDGGGCSTQQSATIAASAPIGLGIYVSDYGGVNIPCAGDSTGVIQASISGGASPVNVIWNGPGGFTSTATDLSGLVAGDYAISISDVNGCTLDTIITLVEPAIPLSTMLSALVHPSGANISCFGGSDGSIDLTVVGGMAPYSYTWHGPPATSFFTEDVSGLIAGQYDLVVTDTNGCSVSASIILSQPDSGLLGTISLSQYAGGFNTSCDGSTDGSISVIASGGSGSYQYDWSGPGGFTSTSDSISALAEGSYVLTLIDLNGCSMNDTIDVIAPEPLSPILDPSLFPGGTNISCNGMSDGALDATITGGAPAYQYSWSGPGGFTSSNANISGLAAGTYCLDVTDANNCTAQQCVIIAEPATLDPSATTTDAACGASNGSIDLTVNGGSTPYGYAWDNGPTTEDQLDLPAGPYTVTITDANGCQAILPVTVNGASALNANGVVQDLVCAGAQDGSIDISVLSGTAPFTFDWNNGASSEDLADLDPGFYEVTVTDVNNCTWTDQFIVGDGATLIIDSTVHVYTNGYNISAAGASDGMISVTASGATAPYTYDWSNGGNTATITGLAAGVYSVTVTDDNGCSVTLSFELTAPNNVVLPTGFSPNGDGANDHYVVPGLDAFGYNHITVFNRWGNVVFDRVNYTNDWGGENSRGEPLANGTYFVILDINHGQLILQDYVDLRR